MTPNPGRAESEMIELLATLVEQYESTEFPTPKSSPPEVLAHYLETRSLSTAEVARATGIRASALSDVLSGERVLSQADAVKLAGFFRVPVGFFLDEE
jgi:antitoxin component HigA of HigAB toxin-antitoxin module